MSKTQKIWLYHSEFPKGKLFDVGQAQKDFEEMAKAGWVDTPAKLPKIAATIEEPKEVARFLLNQVSDKELIAEFNARGIIYQPSPEELRKFAEDYEASIAASNPNKEPTNGKGLFDRFNLDPKELTKEELVVLGAEFDLKLKMTMKEETMINHINDVIENLKGE